MTIDSVTRARRPWPIVDVFWRERGAYPLPAARNTFLMSFVTPMVLGNREKQSGAYRTVFATLLKRVGGLARWQGVDVADLSDFTRIEEMAAAVRAEQFAPAQVRAFHRRSSSFGAHEKIETGFLQQLLIKDYPRQIWPAFVLGTLTNCGYDVSQGAGRFVIGDP